ncbi:MAG: GNAT family N-acetyltransferase [Hyphomicrobiales bacterium]|nr:GNAT family N-acetyltransferase [Hyphomicrobiales bacterium]MBV9428504.1 GNAT family N-acetyltransferase [Bradyrhizobiaceae bacterium]
MTKFDGTFRRATPADAAAIAELVELAGEGLPLCLWTQLAGPGGDPWEVGRKRVRSETTGISYRNALIAELAGKTIGALIGYPLGEPESIANSEHALLVPLYELMNLAPNTWYVNALAAYPEHRGVGLGAALLGEADKFAAAAGLSGLSLEVTDTNTGARRLYERQGYREAARRKMVKDGWQHPGAEWVLMLKRQR